LISMPHATSLIFGAVQAIPDPPQNSTNQSYRGWPECKCDEGRTPTARMLLL
jgi:hypothetical protein